MRNCVVAMAFVALGVSSAGASEMVGRLPAPDKQAVPAKAVASVIPTMPANRRLPAIREASDIPIIPLPKSLRPTRPPVGSPL